MTERDSETSITETRKSAELCRKKILCLNCGILIQTCPAICGAQIVRGIYDQNQGLPGLWWKCLESCSCIFCELQRQEWQLRWISFQELQVLFAELLQCCKSLFGSNSPLYLAEMQYILCLFLQQLWLWFQRQTFSTYAFHHNNLRKSFQEQMNVSVGFIQISVRVLFSWHMKRVICWSSSTPRNSLPQVGSTFKPNMSKRRSANCSW